jgi:ribosomal protein S18 acetylase RimI-like enzyme
VRICAELIYTCSQMYVYVHRHLVQGVARTLIDKAAAQAAALGVEHLYVHVEAENEPARKLYMVDCDFQLEQEETEAHARLRSRNRRLLLWKPLLPS